MNRKDIYNWAQQQKSKLEDGEHVSDKDFILTVFLLSVKENEEDILEDMRSEKEDKSKLEILNELMEESW